jgi:Trk K+ transport system NAD-binding subunit
VAEGQHGPEVAAARAATTVTPRMVRREISDFHRVQERRRRQLPPGAILISLRRGLSVQVPVAASCLEVGDQVTVLIAPEAAEAISILKRGLSGRA